MEINCVGLIAERQGRLEWRLPAPGRETSPSHDAWLIELLIRGLANNSAHRAT